VFDSLLNTLKQGDTTAVVLLVLAVLVVFLLIGWIVQAVRLRRLNRQIKALTRGMEDRNLEEVLFGHLDVVDQTVKRMDALEQAVAVLQAQMPGCLQRVSLVRYDAFEDVGGEQSFSLALLDGHGDGVLLTSVYSRMDIRVYAKAIREGRASHALSQEEQRALRQSAPG
jgi:hypothetical protein